MVVQKEKAISEIPLQPGFLKMRKRRRKQKEGGEGNPKKVSIICLTKRQEIESRAGCFRFQKNIC